MVRRIIGKLFKLEHSGIIQKIPGIQKILHRRFRGVIPALAVIVAPVGSAHGFAYQVPVLKIFLADHPLPLQIGILLYKNPIGMSLF